MWFLKVLFIPVVQKKIVCPSLKNYPVKKYY